MVCHSSLVCGSTFCGSYLPPHMDSNSSNRLHQNVHQSNGHILQNHQPEENNISQAEDQKRSSRIKCYVCDSKVEKRDLSKHLFFGKLKCRDCGQIFNECESFSSSFKSSVCSHLNVAWSASKTRSPIEYLEKKLENKYKDVNNEVYRYGRKLEDLKHQSPWKVVLREIRNSKHLKSMKSSQDKPSKYFDKVSEERKNIIPEKNSSKYSNISIPVPQYSASTSRFSVEKPKKYKCDKRDGKKKRERINELFGSDYKPNNKSLDKMVFGKSKIESTEETTEFLELPSDGRYLIIQESIEECPDCYSALRIDNCIVNIPLMYYKFFCECGIKIFYIPKMPANMKHPITILHTNSQHPLLLKKACVNNTHKRKKKEMRIKTTSDLLR